MLGAATIWSNKAADIATAHVVVGALSLVTGALLTIISFRVLMPVRVAASDHDDIGLSADSVRQAGRLERKIIEFESNRPNIDRGRQCRKNTVRGFFRPGQGAADVPGAADDAGRFLPRLSRADEFAADVSHHARHRAGGQRRGGVEPIARTRITTPKCAAPRTVRCLRAGCSRQPC